MSGQGVTAYLCDAVAAPNMVEAEDHQPFLLRGFAITRATGIFA